MAPEIASDSTNLSSSLLRTTQTLKCIQFRKRETQKGLVKFHHDMLRQRLTCERGRGSCGAFEERGEGKRELKAFKVS